MHDLVPRTPVLLLFNKPLSSSSSSPSPSPCSSSSSCTQIDELHLVDKWEKSCAPSGGHVVHKDKLGRRNGFGEWLQHRYRSTRLVTLLLCLYR